MENINYTYSTKMLGLVTLYNPDPQEAAANILRYIHDVDALIIWDNSPLEVHLKEQVLESLAEETPKIIWHGDGQNRCIAPAINYAWHYAKEHGLELLLLMDQDSKWNDFPQYRKELESLYFSNSPGAYTPYIQDYDLWPIKQAVEKRRIFINSGTVLPIIILDELNGADETFALDALDHDLSFRIHKRGFDIYCLTSCILRHTLGHPRRSKILKIYTPDYGSARTYSMVRSHIINYRKNHKWMTRYECWKAFKEFIFWKFVRIVLVEEDKRNRFKMYVKGIWDGLAFNLQKTIP